MKVRAICLLIDVSNRDSTNGISYWKNIQAVLFQVASKLEPGDAVLLYEKDGVAAYDEVGQIIGALGNYEQHDIVLSKALKEMLAVVHAVNNDEVVDVYVITDHYDVVMAGNYRRTLLKEPAMNKFYKQVGFHFWGVKPCNPAIAELMDAHLRCDCRLFDKPEEITSQLFFVEDKVECLPETSTHCCP